MKCLYCDSETKNPKFCSLSCSGKYNNKPGRIGRPFKHKCLRCNVPTHSSRKYCKICLVERFKPHDRVCGICKKTYTYNQTTQKLRGMCASCNSNRQRRNVKIKAVQYKGGKCVFCGYSKCMRSLHFHHLDSTKKDLAIGSSRSHAWSKLKEELDKCILVCSNCHGEIHDNLIDVKNTV